MTNTNSHSVAVVTSSVPNAISSFSSATYTPGTPLQVSLAVKPSASTMTYAVEDMPPTGWTVSNISNSGVYDPANNKVKWLELSEMSAKTLSYTVTPPVGSSGTKIFTGIASFDGTNVTITGDRSLTR